MGIRIAGWAAAMVILFGTSVAAGAPAILADTGDRPVGGSPSGSEIRTRDFFVDHASTVPGLPQGDRVELFVRERFVGTPYHKPVVLMIHGATTSTVPVFDLPFEDYSWMAFLALSGFDVFAIDLTGYGGSSRPRMSDPCNVSQTQQTALLIPNPLAKTCAPSYPFRLTSIQSDWDDIDAVVDFIRELRGVERVSLVGWSRGVPRAGGYTARHPGKIDRLVLYAPVYRRQTLSQPPATLPQRGVPMMVADSQTFPGWDMQLTCADQFDPAIRPVISATMLEFDRLGSTWGAHGVIRSPVQNTNPANIPPPQGLWGWNPEFAAKITAPTMIIRGDVDTLAPAQDSKDLYEDLVNAKRKVSITVTCASHFMVWEKQHLLLLHASREWLRVGLFKGKPLGEFVVDAQGRE